MRLFYAHILTQLILFFKKCQHLYAIDTKKIKRLRGFRIPLINLIETYFKDVFQDSRASLKSPPNRIAPHFSVTFETMPRREIYRPHRIYRPTLKCNMHDNGTSLVEVEWTLVFRTVFIIHRKQLHITCIIYLQYVTNFN